MASLRLNAPVLRVVLVLILLLIAAGCVGGFMYGQSKVNEYALEVSKKTIDASASDSQIQNLKLVQKQLSEHQDSIKRAQEVVAESASYQYQDQVIKDLRDYANRSGVSIANFDFTPTAGTGKSGTSAGTSSSSSSGSSSNASSSTPSAATAPAATTGAGLKSTTVTVTLKNPVDFNSFMKFLHFIEQSLTKMQISKIELAKVTDKTNKSAVTASALTIEVYLK